MSIHFFKPKNKQEALALLERYKVQGKVVNGGTDEVINLNKKKSVPEAIIFIGQMSELNYIKNDGNRIKLGGTVTYKEMERNEILHGIDGLRDAISCLGSPAIRAIATPAGNICTSAPSADCTTMLLALRAKLLLESSTGKREISIADFASGTYRTIKRPEELLSEISFPSLVSGDGTGYVRIGQRKAQVIAKVIASAFVHIENGICTDAAIGLGALNATAVRAASLEAQVIGKTKKDALSYLKTAFPVEATLRESYYKQYKQQILCDVIASAVEQAWNRAEEVK